ncbi:MAG: hypothetical protein HN742_09760 [Lentisphaerae bacterium]|jgi:hypothetical protein|nr:hypothetical protein [Lentisphaerota bacterium]MBT5610476.1 hypothetical protein [Lentisphaerota bacterium]MBT7061067.1 hypothetical protein [Lentisphaerota bacterium]MBT7842148.1 hypothetical protein [Lentisphaerota bacterium]
MNTPDQLREFLETATAGLRDDHELQLDIRAELLSHLEDRSAELEESGKTPEEAQQLARNSFGSPVDVAADLTAANQRRMRWRSRARLACRILLVPGAVLIALIFSDLPQIAAMSQSMRRLGDATRRLPFESLFARFHRGSRRLSQTENLILHGDPERKTQAERQRAIWETFPQNSVFLNNYITQLACGLGADGPQLKQALAALEEILPKAREIDPGNARQSYLHLAARVALACDVNEKLSAKTATGKSLWLGELIIKDRQALDEAMDELTTVLKMPVYRRYHEEMLQERLAILGRPQTAIERVRQIAMAASVLLPDLQLSRSLVRVSILYGECLAHEGDLARATPFLDAWEPLAIHLNNDSWTLIDCLVVRALIEHGRESSAEIYERFGDHASAERTRKRADILGQPIRNWHTTVENSANGTSEGQDGVKERAGTLAASMLAFGGMWKDNNVSPDMLTYGRLADYVLAEKALISLTSALLLIAIFASLGIGWWWRLVLPPGEQVDSVLLMPDWRKVGRVLVLGVLAPVMLYAIYTRWLPFGAQQYAIGHAWSRAVSEMGLLLFVILATTTTMAGNAVRERCLPLGLAVPTPEHSRLRTAAFVCLLLIPGATALLYGHGWPKGTPSRVAAIVLVVTLGQWLALSGLRWLWRACRARKDYGAYYSTASRSVIPFLAAAIALLSLLTDPYLKRREAFLVQNDPVMAISPELPSCTRIEAELAQRLRRETAAAAERLEEPVSATP